MAAIPPLCDVGWQAPDFRLRGVDERTYGFDDIKGENGTVIIFMCNHCPYVLAILPRLIRDVRDLQTLGLGVAAINANDAAQYPDDSFENMITMATRHDFPFPYLYDENQDVAQAYGAVCTPDFFGFDKNNALRYRGRLDASKKETAPADTRRDLYLAMKQVAETGLGPQEQISSMGCSIKWKPGNEPGSSR